MKKKIITKTVLFFIFTPGNKILSKSMNFVKKFVFPFPVVVYLLSGFVNNSIQYDFIIFIIYKYLRFFNCGKPQQVNL